MRYLLDTNVFIAAMKGVSPVRERLGVVSSSDIVLSPIVLGELEYGVYKSAHREANAQRLEVAVSLLELVPLDTTAARQYGEIRAGLESIGRPIGSNDLWIAAQALAIGATLVTDNTEEFTRIRGLRLENWLRST
ncbi:MAG: type II toxin-antitoxin system VapC family toxin [Burkholderiales bacterium]|nr:type II toxin-antitoxin system VapC family toxin [Burkholderiales bacterium]